MQAVSIFINASGYTYLEIREIVTTIEAFHS